MDAAERWKLVSETFDRTFELDAPARAAVLAATLGSLPDVRRQVERLLTAHDAAGDFLGDLDRDRAAALIAATPDDPPPAAIGRYRIVRALGEGGMGVVYLAHDPELDRPIALKLLRSGRAGAAARARLLQEARAASALDHPNVAAIYEISTASDGRDFIAMAFCEGQSLAERLASGPLPPGEAAHIALQVADALAAAHALGIVHRDVKPDNVIVAPDGRVRLMDFGVAVIARNAGAALPAGTPGYVSPEQLDGRLAGPPSDVWSFGVLLHDLLSGARRSASAPRLSGRLAALADRCLAEDPDDRPSAAEAATTLRGFLRWRELQRPLIGVSALLAVLFALVVGGGLLRGPGAGTGADAPMVILPLVAAGADDQLARDATLLLSDALAALTPVTVADPLLAMRDEQLQQGTDEDRIASAQRAGFGTVVLARFSRSDSLVRGTISVHDARDRRVIASGSVLALPDPSALADSLALALLRSRWLESREPALAAAARGTSSIVALRAFVEGERAIAGARFRLAPELFARAIAADSGFGLAYWRYWFSRSYHGSPVDSQVIAAVLAHRAAFPEPDRLLVQARLGTDARARLEQLRTVTTRHPAYWPGWFELGDHLTHHGAFLGVQLDEARNALRRVTELNPGFVPAWEHRLWTAVLERDTAESGAALARLEKLRLDTLARREWDLRPVDYYRYLVQLARTGGEPSAEEAEIGADVLSGTAGAADPDRTTASMLSFGFPRAQLDLSQRVLARNPAARIATAHTWGSALAWAGRGGWDSAFAAVRQYARTTSHSHGPLRSFGLAVTGAWLGEVHPDSARLLATHAARSAHAQTASGHAELAWLRGVLACRDGDATALQNQQAVLARNSAPSAHTLAASLAAFATALDGNPAAAADALARLEVANAAARWQFAHGSAHPFAIGLHRLAAGSALLATGDSATAASLLLLHETDLPVTLQPLPAVNMMLSPYSLELLAGIEEGRGQAARARRHRQAVRERADLKGSVTVPRAWCGPL
ncbi:MAG TPA: serine/threonine-protein kinase [Longimicrobiales bacterium]|nr:serine/threonine-protein kinase [Longimicrobiales bacterium]